MAASEQELDAYIEQVEKLSKELKEGVQMELGKLLHKLDNNGLDMTHFELEVSKLELPGQAPKVMGIDFRITVRSHRHKLTFEL